MDFSALEVTFDAVFFQPIHFVSAKPLVDEAEKPVGFYVLGNDNPVVINQQHEAATRRAEAAMANLPKKRRGKVDVADAMPSADELREDALATVCAAVTGWTDNVEFEGKKLEFSPANARRLFGHPPLRWLRQQLEQFITDRANFTKPLTKG